MSHSACAVSEGATESSRFMLSNGGGSDWWKGAVVYQVYPRSFQDSNGDGIGDLPGLVSRLDHIQSLGATVLWLCPHYDTPDVDNGYDIRDYRKVDPRLGTMADFDALVAGLHARGMKLIVDLVVNHTSDQHEWFIQSRTDPCGSYRDFYIWRDGRDDGPPNNYASIFGGSAWEKDRQSGQYYLHYFTPEQPDLNWDNLCVRQEIYDVMRFWLARGVSGFRMDAIVFISKPEGLPDFTLAELENPRNVLAHGPHLHPYLQEMHREVLAGRALMTVGEAEGVDFDDIPLFVSPERHELEMLFQFAVIRLGRHDWQVLPWTLRDLKAVIRQEDLSSGPDGWLTSFLENHDNPRCVSWFGDDTPQGRVASAKALAVLLLMRRGTPFIYQGQEIGMTNTGFAGIEDFQDVHARSIWANTVGIGKDAPQDVLHDLRCTSRDNARTPMQWDASEEAGFTTGVPWMRVNPNASEINVAAQNNDPASVLACYRTLIALRAACPTLIYGQFDDIDPEHPSVIAFLRKTAHETLLVLVTLQGEPVHYLLPAGLHITETLFETTPTARSETIDLGPWHGGIYRVVSP